MENKKNEVPYIIEKEQYVPRSFTDKNDTFKKIKRMKALLFYAPIVHLAVLAILLILLIVNLINNSLGIYFTNTEKALVFSYVGGAALLDLVALILPAKKITKKNHYRIFAITTFIISTFIFSWSLFFWAFNVLLFYALITLIVWILEIMGGILLILIVESLPN